MSSIDCVVCGEACVDLLIGPLPLDRPLSEVGTRPIDPIRVSTGGIVPNAGIALARLGMNVAAVSVVGGDRWGEVLLERLAENRVATQPMIVHPSAASSVTAVLIGDNAEHTFAFHAGASQLLDRQMCFERMDLFAAARVALFGYYNLMPNLEQDLPEVLAAIRSAGCQTALDTANGGGSLSPLDRILPHVDIYLPNFAEAQQQTGRCDPQAMIRAYRDSGAAGLVGIKLGEQGALLSPTADEFLPIAPIKPPGPVVDTTGAGDSFFAGLIAGLLRGMLLRDAARLGAAAGACCVTGLGSTTALRDFEGTVALLSDADR